MTYGRCCAVFVCGVLLWAVAGCDDPSTVGVGVGPDSLRGGTPVTLDVGAASQRIMAAPSPTGNQGSNAVWRMLVGTVDDPLTGPLTADAYVDVRSPVVLPDTVLNAPPESLDVELTLQPSYVHGDTTSTVTFAVLDVDDEMEVVGATSDQTFPASPIRDAGGQAVTTAFTANRDSVISIPLPQQWVADNVDVLKDTTDGGRAFADAFHGFRLEARGGNAIVGFNRSSTALEIQRADGDLSSQFTALKQFTHVARTGEKPTVDDRFIAVDGLGETFAFTFNFDAPPLDTLSGAFVNRASIIAPVDTTAWTEMRPADFVRPRSGLGFRTVARLSDTLNAACSDVNVPALSDSTCAVPMVSQAAPGAALTDLNVSLRVFRQSLLSSPVFSNYRLEIAANQNTQNTLSLGLPSTLPVVYYRPSPASLDSTRATITVTSQ